jgi:hypothetical protein
MAHDFRSVGYMAYTFSPLATHFFCVWEKQPYSEDTVLYAIPMCAPYDVLRDFKFKVKLIPGTLKRGKAIKQAVEYFGSSREVTKREKDCMKQVGQGELSMSMLSNVKVVVPGSTGGKKKKGGGGGGGKQKKNKEK